MNPPIPRRRCAVYTRKSSEEGLDQAFNSLDAQREAGVAYIQSQVQEGWQLVETPYDDGGYSGATLERPALQQLLADIGSQRIQVVVVYKVDRLTRSLGDFAQLIDLFDQHGVAFASVTQQFQTTTSMGRLVLNVLLSFAQFEREVTGERIRDKIAASKKKGWWMGGLPPLGYDVEDRQLIINEKEAQEVRHLFQRYLALRSVSVLVKELRAEGRRTKVFTSRAGRTTGGRLFSRGHLYHLLHNRVYCGEIVHRKEAYPGNHSPIIDDDLWQQTQALLKANHQAWHRDTQVQTPFLLKGILFDTHGNRFSPTRGRKGPRAYRYYVNQVVLQFRETDPKQIRRMPAEPLEQRVMNSVMEALKEEQGAQVWIDHVKELDVSKQQTLVRQLLRRVEMNADRLRITYNPPGVMGQESINSKQDSESEMKKTEACFLEVPWMVTRRGGRTELQFKGVPAPPRSQHHDGLVTAMVRAVHWKNDLLAGRVATMKALAQREGLARSYVMRVLRLSFLAPDLIEAILDGQHPPEFTLERFRRPIPLDWAAQRKLFGLPLL